MDDIIIFGRTREELVSAFSGVLATLEFHDLRVNGKKVTALGTSYSILGRRIENGRVFASPHIIENLNKLTTDGIVTVKNLRGAIGLMSFISEFCPYSAMVLDPIRKLAVGSSSDKVIWTEESKLQFKKAIEVQDELMAKSPIREDLDLILSVDTSYAGTGAVLYQFDPVENKRLFNGFFSKKRTTDMNKTLPGSCIIELQGICAAMLYFLPHINNSAHRVTVRTDSKS